MTLIMLKYLALKAWWTTFTAHTLLIVYSKNMLAKNIPIDTNTDLFRELRPHRCEDLTRVGGYKDGGYLVPLGYLKGLTTFVNFGVGEDFDFEIQLKHKYGVSKILSFDSLVSKRYFVIHFLKGLIKFFKLKAGISVVFQRFFLLLKFIYFYSLLFDIKFIKVKIDKFNADSILSNLPQNSALKVDIEGGEYAILDTICTHKSKLNFIILEFHSIQLNEITILNFIKNLGSEFFIAHLSINNWSSDVNLLPQTIEVTFCRGSAKYNDFVDELPNDKLDWHFSNKPIYSLNYNQ